jgi:hypothetical protein
MLPGNLRERVFRRMLAREAGTNANASAVAAAARRLYEQLGQQLTPLVGGAGAAAIFARSLHLTHRRLPGLAPVRVPDEVQEPLARAQRFLESQESAAATQAAIAVLMMVCELLESFIGSALTTGLLRRVWPDDFGSGTTEETRT